MYKVSMWVLGLTGRSSCSWKPPLRTEEAKDWGRRLTRGLGSGWSLGPAGLYRQKWSQALQAERIRKAEACDAKPWCG